jgi:hypothetical protein
MIGHPHRFTRLVHPVDLFGEIIRHRGAIGLVVGRDVVAERGPGEVERRGHVGRRVILDQLPQHGHEDVDRVRRMTFLVRQTATAERVVRAVHLRTAVDEKQSGAGQEYREPH